MRIDAHQHFWHYDRDRYPSIDDRMPVLRRDYLSDDLMPSLAEHLVDASICVQATHDTAETAWLLSLTRQQPCGFARR